MTICYPRRLKIHKNWPKTSKQISIRFHWSLLMWGASGEIKRSLSMTGIARIILQRGRATGRIISSYHTFYPIYINKYLEGLDSSKILIWWETNCGNWKNVDIERDCKDELLMGYGLGWDLIFIMKILKALALEYSVLVQMYQVMVNIKW